MLRTIAYLIAASAIVSIALPASDAFALNERVTLEQTAAGDVVATLSGVLYPCTYGPIGAPTTAVSAGQVLIASRFVALGCPTPVEAIPFPYTQSASLGMLADGAYTLTWTQTGVPAPFHVRTRFLVEAGVLSIPNLPPHPVPSSTPWSFAALALLVFLTGSRRWRPFAAHSGDSLEWGSSTGVSAGVRAAIASKIGIVPTIGSRKQE